MGRTGADWSTVFRRSTVHPAVFAVRDSTAASELVSWAGGGPLAHRHQAYAFSAELDGWALLDGGLSYLQARAHGRLRSGLRVIGWSALRHLTTQLGLVPPRRLLVGEQARRGEEELERLARSGWVAAPPAGRQATLLVSYVDARGLNEVACTLVSASISAFHAASGQQAPSRERGRAPSADARSWQAERNGREHRVPDLARPRAPEPGRLHPARLGAARHALGQAPRTS